MPLAAGQRTYENHIPSSMSVYDMDPNMMENRGLVVGAHTKLGGATEPYVNMPPQENDNSSIQTQSHKHRDSTSTQASDSTDSSPTTTVSTVDSSSLSDPSPSSSPESPITIVPLSSFTATTFGIRSLDDLTMSEEPPQRHLPILGERPMTSPSPRKAKNPKSLALNLSANKDAISQNSEPLSPSAFIKPPAPKARRKPSQLSLHTGTSNMRTLALEPPASPSIPMLQRRGLKHSMSSPQIIATPAFGPAGGMTLERDHKLSFGDAARGGSRLKESSLAKTSTIDEDMTQEVYSFDTVQVARRVPGVTVGGDSFDRPQSGEDAKSPSYPDGPVLMHEPHVHLYSEPSIEEAMKFDVIINVAREVKNPFEASVGPDEAKEWLSINPSDAIPDTAISTASFWTAFEVQPGETSLTPTLSSPTTPKPAPSNNLPEYIHIPWDHNTDVKDELWDLCETIENRTKQGKKILVHCQQGASRSATLIIAYGMYINQDIGSTEAYKAAQARSRWVNPNMSLLFSLNDFKKVIEEKKAAKRNQRSVTCRSPTRHRVTLSADAIEFPQKEHQAASLQGDNDNMARNTDRSPMTTSRARGNSTPSFSAGVLGQGSSDSSTIVDGDESMQGFPRPDTSTISNDARMGSFDFGFGNSSSSNAMNDSHACLGLKNPTAVADSEQATSTFSPRTLFSHMADAFQGFAFCNKNSSSRQVTLNYDDYGMDESGLMSPRLQTMTMNPLQQASPRSDATHSDVPPSPGLFSPRISEFPRGSFFSMIPEAAPPRADEDPRSPPTKGEAPIHRSIDDVL